MNPISRKVFELSEQQIRFEKTAQIIAHWIALSDAADPGTIPMFDPMGVPGLLPYVYLLQRDGERFRYRVSGEEVNRLFGSNHTGRYLDDVVPVEIYPEVAPYFFKVLDGNICVLKGFVLLPGQEHLEFERVLLPVERKGEIQLLGTLSLSSNSPLRHDRSPPAAPDPGFHFYLLDLSSGGVQADHKNLLPLADRYSLSKGFQS
ncbi:PAS domain-containing protein [Nisaea sp.]|uniref:PAS domain-containing protein n=1 Tax=Nisaea sp. TaxID=2024842 RepID=UPI003B5182AD